jgi:MFS family permease
MGALFAVLTEGLPRRWRGAGFGLLYASMVGVFGGATQPVLAWALERWADPWLPVWLLVAAGAVQFLAALLVPETRPQGEYGKG